MPTKRTPKVQSTAEKKVVKPIRLDLNEADHSRLVECAEERGLTNAGYARMAVLERIKADEAKR